MGCDTGRLAGNGQGARRGVFGEDQGERTRAGDPAAAQGDGSARVSGSFNGHLKMPV